MPVQEGEQGQGGGGGKGERRGGRGARRTPPPRQPPPADAARPTARRRGGGHARGCLPLARAAVAALPLGLPLTRSAAGPDGTDGRRVTCPRRLRRRAAVPRKGAAAAGVGQVEGTAGRLYLCWGW